MVEAEVPNQQGQLRPGSFANAEIVPQAQEKAVVVPASALVTFAGVDKVLVVKDGKSLEKRVTTGRRDGDRVEIVSGLDAGEQVIVDPGNLVGGEPVQHRERVEHCAGRSRSRPGRRRARTTIRLGRQLRSKRFVMKTLAAICIKRPGVRGHAHPGADRGGHRELSRARRRPLPRRRPAHRDGPHAAPGRVARGRRKCSSRSASRRRSTPSRASTSCARCPAPASRSSSRRSTSIVTSNRPRRTSAIASSAILVAAAASTCGRRSSRKQDNDRARPHHRRLRRSSASRADRDRRQDRSSRSSNAPAASASVEIVGGLERAINVWVDADRLAAYSLPITARARRAVAAERRPARRQRHRRTRASRRSARWAGSSIRRASTIW